MPTEKIKMFNEDNRTHESRSQAMWMSASYLYLAARPGHAFWRQRDEAGGVGGHFLQAGDCG
jgi:hypothetical protein